MKSFESTDSLNEDTPYLIFLEKLFFLLMLNYFLIKVTIVSELHDNATLKLKYQRFLPSKKTSL